jgi:RimJ/RimL family protein N-acetyltransferase
METDLNIDDDIYLTKSSRGDKEELMLYLNDQELFNQTLRIPSPYTEQDAENWFNYILGFESENKRRKNWVIRNNDHALMGHVGFHFTHGLESETVEIYYWLGKPFRNKGIITRVISCFTDHAFSTLNYKRLEAPIFDFNTASENALIKSGYTFENHLPDHYTKGNKFISAKMYAKTVTSGSLKP